MLRLYITYIVWLALVFVFETTAFRLPAFGLAEIGSRLRSRKNLRTVASVKGKGKGHHKVAAKSRGKGGRADPQMTVEEMEEAGLDPDLAATLGNISNASNFTGPPPSPPPPPSIPRHPGPLQDDPYTNATGCEPFPCELEDHYRPPKEPLPPLPLPQCGMYGHREKQLAWNANINSTMNLTVELSTLVKVHVGIDETYNKPHVQTMQPSYLMNYQNGMNDFHDCREIHTAWLGYFEVVCEPTISYNYYSEDEFKMEWGIGNLTIANATLENGTYTPWQCIPDVYPPNLESMEVGAGEFDSQYLLFVLESRAPYLDKYRTLPTTLPTLWLPWRCPTCTVPNPAYWGQMFGNRPELNLSNLTIINMSNITNTTWIPPVKPIDKLDKPDPLPGNFSQVPKKPPWSKRLLYEPLPPGLPSWSQIIYPWDGLILRFDECVIATGKSIVWTPLNPPPLEISPLQPRGYRDTFNTMKSLATDTRLVNINCGNVTIRPPFTFQEVNMGKLYEIEIPEGTFHDHGAEPNYASGWKFNVTVADLISPHVHANWGTAFYPLAFHSGRYPWHNITISFDETMMLNPRFTEHVVTLNPRDDKYKTIVIDLHNEELATWLDSGRTLHINPFGHAKDDWTGDPVGLELGAKYYVTVEPNILCDLFGNNFTGISTCPKLCNIEIAPTYPYEPCSCTGVYHFQVATPEQMEMRKKIAFMLKYTRRRINNTLEMFHLPTTQDEQAIDGMPLQKVWPNSFTQGRMLNIMFFVGQAQKVLDQTDGINKIAELNKIYDELTGPLNKFEPKGYPFKDPWVCKDLMSHVVPGVMDCDYTAQKSGTGFDVWTQSLGFYFREGCMCRVHWKGGCPYALHHWPTYKDFGFHMYEERFINGALGSNGVTENYLCWYWSTPDNPEWGYMAHPKDNLVYNLDPTQQFKCAHPRIPEQPCSTLRYWEWDIGATQKLYFNKASAWRPTLTEAGPGAAFLQNTSAAAIGLLEDPNVPRVPGPPPQEFKAPPKRPGPTMRRVVLE